MSFHPSLLNAAAAPVPICPQKIRSLLIGRGTAKVKLDVADAIFTAKFMRKIRSYHSSAATDRPVETSVTRNLVPNGKLGWAAVNAFGLNCSPLAVCSLPSNSPLPCSPTLLETTREQLVFSVHQDFSRRVIPLFSKRWTISRSRVLAYVDRIEAERKTIQSALPNFTSQLL
jgi:hypothetical protein